MIYDNIALAEMQELDRRARHFLENEAEHAKKVNRARRALFHFILCDLSDAASAENFAVQSPVEIA